VNSDGGERSICAFAERFHRKLEFGAGSGEPLILSHQKSPRDKF
jgi:hypothetical protein